MKNEFMLKEIFHQNHFLPERANRDNYGKKLDTHDRIIF